MKGAKKYFLFLIVLLAISLIAPSIPQVQADSGEWQVDFSTDDCTRYDATFTLTLTVSPYWASNAYTMGSGMRWRNINIPQGATILSAYIKYRSTGTHVQPASPIVIITGEDEDNCATFSTKLNYDGRTRTEASVEYTLPATIADVWYDTNDLSSIIQEIIDREGWESGYAIALFSGPKDETNIAAGGWSFNRADGSSASKLFITWSEEPPIYPPSDPNLLFGAGFNSSSPYVELHWNHSLVDVQFFEVQNSSDGESWTYLGQSTTANYTDSQVVNGTERYYKVRACNQTEGSWYNSSWADVNFETVYFILGVGNGVPEEDYSIIFLAIGLILMLSIAFLYVKTR